MIKLSVRITEIDADEAEFYGYDPTLRTEDGPIVRVTFHNGPKEEFVRQQTATLKSLDLSPETMEAYT